MKSKRLDFILVLLRMSCAVEQAGFVGADVQQAKGVTCAESES
jgi:hypothetical protein